MAKKSNSSSKRTWVIEGYNGSKRFYREEISVGHFTDRTIELCLQALCAAELDPNEIVGAYARRSTTRANNLLEVHVDRRNNTYQCGNSTHFTARKVGGGRNRSDRESTR